ncbi:serine/threonine protein kinase Ran1 [Boothiomyces sp. JEL0866]|nr:serine/threonine protein kinase Ran1 [Boothiomyces sp. JEL0866]
MKCGCKTQRKQGFMIKSMIISQPHTYTFAHTLDNCTGTDKKKCSRHRNLIIADLLSRLSSVTYLRSITLSSNDLGHGPYINIDLVFTKELGEDSLNYINQQLLKGKYQVIQAEPDIPVTFESSPVKEIQTSKLEANLGGLSCDSCVKKVSSALDQLPGIISVNVSLTDLVVEFDPKVQNANSVISSIQNLGYKIQPKSNLGQSLEIIVDNSHNEYHKSTIIIAGMSCTSCVATIEANLKAIPGVDANSLVVTLLPPQAVVTHDSRFLTTVDIIHAIEDMGFEGTLKSSVSLYTDGLSKASTVKIGIEGMTCSSCVNSIESYMKEQGGITTITAVIQYDSTQIGVRDILKLIEEIGFVAKLYIDDSINIGDENKELCGYLKDTKFALIFVIPAFIISMVFMMVLPHSHPINQFFMKDLIPGLSVGDITMFLLASPVQFWLGRRFYYGAWKSLVFLKTANMDVLVALGTTVSYLFSIYSLSFNIIYGKHLVQQFFETSIFLIFFILVGKSLEVFAKGKTTDAIKHLLTLTPNTALLVFPSDDDPSFTTSEQSIDITLVQVGDILKVLPGARIPTDGLIFHGNSYVDESMLTGESLPIYKAKGDSVFAGTVNQSNVILIKVVKTGSETTLSRIISLVQEAQSSRAPIQIYADKISAIFVPAVLVISALTWLLWMSAFEFGFIPKSSLPVGRSVLLFATEHAISVLVIACPCALGLATPTAVMVGSGVAAKLGILIKGGGAALELSYSIKTIVFDKTGTLTMGSPQVTGSQCFDLEKYNINTERNFWKLLATLEGNSDHPLGKAICNYFRNQIAGQVDEEDFILSDISEKSGMGLTATVKSKVQNYKIFVGNEKWMIMNNCDSNSVQYKPVIDRWKITGKSIVMAGMSVLPSNIPNVTDHIEGSVIGIIGIADQIRAEAPKVLASLQKRGIDVWMLTGDHDTTARAVASQLGILPNRIISEVLPAEKYQKVKELQLTSIGKVAMVGDGINDSVALAQADIGIAIGSGSDIAIEAAQVILVKANLLDVLTLLDLSKKTFNRIKLNFGWAFGFNVIGIPLAAGAFFFWGITLSPMFAAQIRFEKLEARRAAAKKSVVPIPKVTPRPKAHHKIEKKTTPKKSIADRLGPKNQADELNAILIGNFGSDEVLACVGDNGLVSIYYTNDLNLKPIQLVNDESTWGLAICPKYSLLAVSDNGYKITIWNLSTSNDVLGEYKKILRGHEHNIPCINFSEDGETLISCSIDKTMRIWNVASGQLLNTLSVNPEWNWKGCFINFEDVKLVSDMDKIWATIKRESENPFSNRQPSFQDALPYLERLYLLFMERESARSIVMDRQRASPRESEPVHEETTRESTDIDSVSSTASFASKSTGICMSEFSDNGMDLFPERSMTEQSDDGAQSDSNSSHSYHTAEDLQVEEYQQHSMESSMNNIEINIDDVMDEIGQNATHDELSRVFNNSTIGNVYGPFANIALVSTIKDLYVVDPTSGPICCIPNLFPRYHFDPNLNGMERISILEWIPELSLVVASSQRGKIALIRLVRSEKRIGMSQLNKSNFVSNIYHCNYSGYYYDEKVEHTSSHFDHEFIVQELYHSSSKGECVSESKNEAGDVEYQK